MKNKQWISLLLAICMLLSLLPLTVFAEEDVGTDTGEPEASSEPTSDVQSTGEDEPEVPTVFAATAAELEAALEAGNPRIEITASFAVDRTFYVTQDTSVFSTDAVTLLRAPDFAGDIFVIGEDAAGDAVGETVCLTLGSEGSDETDLLVFDGNKDNMTVDVSGTVIFAPENAAVEIYPDVTFCNCKKVANERTATEGYVLSYPDRIGAAVLINAGGTVDIYGGSFRDNEVLDMGENSLCYQGGVIYNYGTMNIRGGTFAGNHAARGGAIFNYRKLNIYGGTFTGNSASTTGGAIDMPNSTAAKLVIDGDETAAEPNVVFSMNTATSNGGAIVLTEANMASEIRDAAFTGNTSGATGGAVCADCPVTLSGVAFSGNSAKTAGALCAGGTMQMSDCAFTSNSSTGEAAALQIPEGGVAVISNTTFTNNTAGTHGGALSVRSAQAEFTGCTLSGNTAGSNGGACYLSYVGTSDYDADVLMSRCTVTGNTASGSGGAFYVTRHLAESTDRNLELRYCTVSTNTATAYGGAILLTAGSHAYCYSTDFEGNRANSTSSSAGGGAFYVSGSSLELNLGTVKQNTTAGAGGAAVLTGSAAMLVNGVTFSENASTKTGGAIYANASSLTAYESTFASNHSTSHGGAVYVLTGASVHIYDSEFNSNISDAQAGALYFSAGADVDSVVQNTIFTGNSAETLGGVTYVTGSTHLNLYNITAKNNSAATGGFMDETTTGTTVNVNGLTVSGNTATDGPIIWMNSAGAILNINKSNYIDQDHTGALDADYWSAAITASDANKPKLKINDLSGMVPSYDPYDNPDPDPVELTDHVTNAAELRLAIETGLSPIQIMNSFEVDRTIYVTHDTVIYSTEAVTLTRAANFGGDLFVVGEDRDGNAAEGTVRLVLGDAASETPDLLTIDGNKDNMIVSVKGTAIFAEANAEIEIYPNVTFRNLKKDGNERTLDEKYDLSYRNRIGSPVAIIAGGTMTVYGGSFIDNEALDMTDPSTEDGMVSSQGGAIYNYGTLNIYGGTFADNHAARGGAIYNYRTLNITAATFTGNTSSDMGGAIYMANSTAASLSVEGAESAGVPSVQFSQNTAGTHGGAVVLQSANTASLENVLFANNAAQTNGGAVYALCDVTFTSVSFAENSAGKSSGAAYTTGNARFMVCSFTDNSSDAEAGAIYSSDGAVLLSGCTFTSNTSGTHGGAVALRSAKLDIYESTFDGNTAGSNGGTLYISYNSASEVNCSVEVFDSSFTNSTAANGGAVYATAHAVSEPATVLTMHDTTLQGNRSTSAGGAIYLTGGSSAYLNGCGLTQNTAATNGGACYVSNSSLELDGVTFDADSANQAGAIYATSGADILMNETTFTNMTTTAIGGVLYSNAATVTVYDSSFENNRAGTNGGVMYLTTSAVTHIYSSVFNNNIADNQAGVLYLNTGDAGETVVQDTTFTGNSAATLGGVIYATGKSKAYLYDIVAKDNTAGTGGFMDETTTGTTVNINGLTVSGNTAPNGPIIWMNSTGAILNINKNNYTDLNQPAPYDVEYWAYAITSSSDKVEGLQINSFSGEAPEYPPYEKHSATLLDEAVDVFNADELETAINAQVAYIRIADDFVLDRTFYITSNTVIFAASRHVLARDPAFAGDIFVVGEDAKGNSVNLNRGKAVLTLGDPTFGNTAHLVINGNRSNMTVPVTGSVIFASSSATVNLYSDIAIINCEKTGNVKLLDVRYGVTNPTRAGGAVAIVASGIMNVYGGLYSNNATTGWDGSSEVEGGYGGIFTNYSNLYIYGGTFRSNRASYGGAICNYSDLKIYGGTFAGNYANKSSGAIYNVSSAYAQTQIGMENDLADGDVQFINNSAVSSGGAVTVQTNGVLVIYGRTSFTRNYSVSGGGGAIYATGSLTAFSATFTDNTAYSYGGAIYVSNNNDERVTRECYCGDSVFTGNKATHGGAAAVYASSADFSEGGILTLEGCTLTDNAAVDMTPAQNSSDVSGGAVYVARKGTLKVLSSAFNSNDAAYEGGAICALTECTLTVSDSEFNENASAGNGGAVSIHSVKLTASNNKFDGNTSVKSGAALYVSYSSASAVNSSVTLKNSTLTNNTAGTYAGAIYVTRHAVEKPATELTVRGCVIDGNTAGISGGAVYVTAGAKTYFYDTDFLNNYAATDTESTRYGGGAVCCSGSEAEFNACSFTDNSSAYEGGAICSMSSGKVTVNETDFTGNDALGNAGGAIYSTNTQLSVYNSTFTANTASGNGGAIDVHSASEAKLIGCTFTENTATGNGGALMMYSDAEHTERIQGCTFLRNTADGLGGGIYTSNGCQLGLYDNTATENAADKGGFLYITTTGTVVNLAGLTVSGNTAVTAGPIIYGNSNGAVLNINKALYTDSDTETLDAAYWESAIVNLLTVNETGEMIPTCPSYTNPESGGGGTTKPGAPLLVSPIFELAEESSEADINATYGMLPRLDNSSNFMSRETTYFENINGGTVSVDTLVSHEGEAANNGTFAEGILIYEALLYKQAHPEEEVYISVSSYRVSAYTAICINRDSRYFGYCRNLTTTDYDQFGFVRISYLLLAAASMGIHVTLINQLDGYPPTSKDDRVLIRYVNSFTNRACDPTYVTDGVIGDYMNYQFCYWTVGADGKGGTDMMHTKLCAVSHYIDCNGVEHRNAIWTDSTNLDGINAAGTNGHNSLQAGTIISDHADLYRISYNYLHILSQYCRQEDVYAFRELIIGMNTEQIELILAGRENEIPAGEQIVYLGSETDDVFELYYTPLGGGSKVWDEDNNPFCKYLREFSETDDYVELVWNNANYIQYPLVEEMEAMISRTYHDNRSVNNKIYTNLAEFDASVYKDLQIGVDIGFMSLGVATFGKIHAKDLLLSYSLNGQRKYVSVLNSANMHSGALSYQSNYILVIKETDGSEGSVYFTMADQSSKGIVEHNYGTDIHIHPAEGTSEAYSYVTCLDCGKEKVLGNVHTAGDWIIDREATAECSGIRHKECTICGQVTEASEIDTNGNVINSVDYSKLGLEFREEDLHTVDPLTSAPKTFEVTVQIDKSLKDRAGTVIGNYNGDNSDQFNIEIYTSGKPRLWYKVSKKTYSYSFKTDIRSDNPVHLAITVDGLTASLYVNGALMETVALAVAFPECTNNCCIGGDNRAGNTQYFKGKIYTVHLFDDVRTPEEIALDAVYVSPNAENLIYGELLGDRVYDAQIWFDSSRLDSAAPTDSDLQSLDAAYADKNASYGELHDHSNDGDPLAPDLPLGDWVSAAKEQMDFGTILSSHQFRQMYYDTWDDNFLIGGVESTGTVDGSILHYNMLFTDPEGLKTVLGQFPGYQFTGGNNGEYQDASFDRTTFGRLIDTVQRNGGFFVLPHPASSDTTLSNGTDSLYFRDYVGLEVLSGDRFDAANDTAYAYWTALLAQGCRIYPVAGGNGHTTPDTDALTTVYAEGQTSGAAFEAIRQGNFTAGGAGIRLMVGSAQNGSHSVFSAEDRVVVYGGDIHPDWYQADHKYQLRVFEGETLIVAAPLEQSTASATVAFAADPDADYYRAEIVDLTDNVRVAICSPVWNDAAEETAPKISSAYLQLCQDIHLIYTAQIPEGMENPYMVFRFRGNEYVATDYTVNDKGEYCFDFGKITPQYMGENISATLYAESNGRVLQNSRDSYSVKEYCDNLLEKTEEDTALITLLADILTYGAAAQIYTGNIEGGLVTDGMTAVPSTFEELSGKCVSFIGTEDEGADWTAASLVLYSSHAIRFKFRADDIQDLSIRFSINGRTETVSADAFTAVSGQENMWYADFRDIEATEFDDTVTAVFCRDNTPIGRAICYSVNTYICSMQNSTEPSLAQIVRALYNYGNSAVAYQTKLESTNE